MTLVSTFDGNVLVVGAPKVNGVELLWLVCPNDGVAADAPELPNEYNDLESLVPPFGSISRVGLSSIRRS